MNTMIQPPTMEVDDKPRWTKIEWQDGNFGIETRQRQDSTQRNEIRRRRFVSLARSIPLLVRWNLYFDKCERTEGAPAFPESLKLLAQMTNAASFWEWANEQPAPTRLGETCQGPRVSCGYYFFRDPVPPVWEDERHRGGGKICLAGKTPQVDQLWLRLTSRCALSGNDDDALDTVAQILGCGLVLKRDGWKLSVWIPKISPLDTRRMCAWMVQICGVEPQHVSYLPHPSFAKPIAAHGSSQTRRSPQPQPSFPRGPLHHRRARP